MLLLTFKKAPVKIPCTLCRRYSSFLNKSFSVVKPLKQPTWSIQTLLPESIDETLAKRHGTSALFHHMLLISSLPYPSILEESKMLNVLRTQLHFVQDVQRVFTYRVRPFIFVNDETYDTVEGQTIKLVDIEEALFEECEFGHGSRPRRRKQMVIRSPDENWDLSLITDHNIGHYIMVDSIGR